MAYDLLVISVTFAVLLLHVNVSWLWFLKIASQIYTFNDCRSASLLSCYKSVQQKTGFVTHRGSSCEWINGGSSFMTVINTVLQGVKAFSEPHVDDAAVYSDDRHMACDIWNRFGKKLR